MPVKKKPLPERIDRIEERLAEIKLELAELNQNVEGEELDSEEKAEIMATVGHLRDEERVLRERLDELEETGSSPER
ncbi:MAG: hypothetical protein DWQ40_01855 [Actinobacteria bacterium]|nr:MAG: hypothetical protein DWQ40_01855 [Actinomycetota bacterium]